MSTSETSDLSNPAGAPERQDIVAIGASAGGVEALADFASRLPAGLPAAVFIVLHMPAYGHSVLPEILSRRGPLVARHAEDGELIQPGRIYVAPPDHHLLIRDGHILLTRGPAENNHRPAIDTLFRAAARSYGPRVVGIVLSGTLDDGTAGLQAIKTRGGTALVQDPEEAMFTGMPRSAIENVAVDGIQTIAVLAETVVRLAGELGRAGGITRDTATGRRRRRLGDAAQAAGRPSGRKGPPGLAAGLPRGPLGDLRRRAGSLPLPGRPCLLPAESAGLPVGKPGRGPVGRAACPGRKRRDGRAPARTRRRARACPVGAAVRRAGK